MKKIIGMSSCLAGYFVRYDGETEYRAYLMQQLQQKYSVLTFCPEVAIGLAVPRAPIHLRHKQGKFYVVDKHSGRQDYTLLLQNYAALIAKRYPSLQAYIFKQSSPSCGVGKTKLHDASGQFINAYDNGVFADELKNKLPKLQVFTEDKLETEQEICAFLAAL